MLSKAPIAKDRDARALARPPCTACYLCHSSASSKVKRCLGGSSRDAQRKTDPLHALGTGVANAEAGVDPAAAEAADGLDACTPVAVRVAADSPDGPAASDAGRGTSTPALTSPSVATAEGGSPAPAGVPRAGSSATAAGVTSTGTSEAEVPVSITAASSAAAAEADAPSSIAAAADPAAAAGTSVPPPVADVPSALSASRSITSPA
nr:skin secretory protein xP2-like [Setaria viridis]